MVSDHVGAIAVSNHRVGASGAAAAVQREGVAPAVNEVVGVGNPAPKALSSAANGIQGSMVDLPAVKAGALDCCLGGTGRRSWQETAAAGIAAAAELDGCTRVTYSEGVDGELVKGAKAAGAAVNPAVSANRVEGQQWAVGLGQNAAAVVQGVGVDVMKARGPGGSATIAAASWDSSRARQECVIQGVHVVDVVKGDIFGDEDNEAVVIEGATEGHEGQQRSLLSRCLTLASSASSIEQSGAQGENWDGDVLVSGAGDCLQQETQLGTNAGAGDGGKVPLGFGAVGSASVKEQRPAVFGADPWEQPSVGFGEYLKQLVQEYGGDDGDE
jgi:hypothetical protein